MSVSVTLRDLLHASELRLVPLVSAHSAIDGDQAPVDWVHHSDLADPTPFVARNQVLLITRPRKIRTAQEYDVYVERLARVGVVALGFGVKVFSDETPPALIAACHRHQLRLFEVPFATPFIAVSRFVARKQAQLAQARDAQTLSALNGLSSAALRPDGVRSLLRELAKRLNGDVLLTDVLGTVTASAGTAVVPEIAERVRGEAHRLGSRGQRATSSFATDEVYASLQTVGPGEGLRGILVVLTQRPVSPSDHAVATSAVALLALLLKQKSTRHRDHALLRSTVLELLLQGETSIGHQVLSTVGEELPEAPVVVAVFSGTRPWNAHPWDSGFVAEHDGHQVAVVSATAPVLQESAALAARGGRIGLSAPTTYAQLPIALSQGQAAQRITSDDEPVREWARSSSQGLEWIQEVPHARARARAILAPLLVEGSEELLPSLRVWLEATGSWDVASRELGIHRHTLRRRINTIETMLDRDLSGMNARTDVWLALQALDANL